MSEVKVEKLQRVRMSCGGLTLVQSDSAPVVWRFENGGMFMHFTKGELADLLSILQKASEEG